MGSWGEGVEIHAVEDIEMERSQQKWAGHPVGSWHSYWGSIHLLVFSDGRSYLIFSIFYMNIEAAECAKILLRKNVNGVWANIIISKCKGLHRCLEKVDNSSWTENLPEISFRVSVFHVGSGRPFHLSPFWCFRKNSAHLSHASFAVLLTQISIAPTSFSCHITLLPRVCKWAVLS